MPEPSVTYQFGESEDAVRIYYSGMRVETFEALEKDSAELIRAEGHHQNRLAAIQGPV